MWSPRRHGDTERGTEVGLFAVPSQLNRVGPRCQGGTDEITTETRRHGEVPAYSEEAQAWLVVVPTTGSSRLRLARDEGGRALVPTRAEIVVAHAQRAEDERRRAEDRAQRAEDERRRAEDRGQRAEDERRRAEDDRQRAERAEAELARLRALLEAGSPGPAGETG